MTRLVLASRSAARRNLLNAAGVPFEAAASSADEEAAKREFVSRGLTGPALAIALAEAKALPLSSRDPEAFVLGADQTLTLGDETFDKPACLEEARAQLLRLRGRSHELHSAIAVLRSGQTIWSHCATARLAVRPFSDSFLERYLEAEGAAICDCVGGYRLEGKGAQLFDEVDGDFFTVLGLPLIPLLGFLREAGILAP